MHESDESDETVPDEGFELLWTRVMDNWSDPKAHGAVLEYAINRQRLPEAAGRYRALKDDPEKGAEAKKRLEGIVVATTSLLMASATPRTARKVPPYVTVLALVLSSVLMFWLARLMLAGR